MLNILQVLILVSQPNDEISTSTVYDIFPVKGGGQMHRPEEREHGHMGFDLHMWTCTC